MKKRGVINQQLSNALAGLGHGDYFLLCDAGFPIPKEAERVDLALTFGIPNMEKLCETSQEELVKLANNAKFIVRSGELRCYSNILLEAASGVDIFKNDFIIDPAQI